MCGISGSLGLPPSEAILAEQLRLLSHRGPDAAAWFSQGHGTVAQNRLAVIDLETGDPPITNEDRTVGVVLNGEIYNFLEVRAVLQRSGHDLRTRGDTEILAHLAEDLEPVELARRLEGMFAFAIWDSRRNRLVLGRDRLGKKPLYYWSDGQSIVFASEIKGVLADPRVPRELDAEAIPAYLSFGYVPTPRTFFRGIRSLPPGHVLAATPGSEPRLERYWEVPLRRGPATRRDLTEAAAEVRITLTEAVERRLVADVPLGAFLSGGIDSSAIVAIMAGPLGRSVETFTIGFEDAGGFDERPYARQVAERYRTSHHEFVVRPDAVELIERLVWHHDQPFGDSSAVPTFLLNQMTRNHVTVALSGDGGDELYAGYERFAASLLAARFRRIPEPVRRAVREGVGRLPRDALRGRIESVQRFLRHADLEPLDAYRSWVGLFDDSTRQELTDRAPSWAMDDFRACWDESEGADHLERLLRLNIRTYLLDDLLVKADRMSMAHALEVRSPFLDPALVEHAASLHSSLKLGRMALKRVLKEAVRDLLPDEIVHRRKKGFGVPVDRWFREDLASYVRSMLGAPDARVRGHLRGQAVDRLLAEHASGAGNHGHRLWTLLTLEVFLRREGW